MVCQTDESVALAQEKGNQCKLRSACSSTRTSVLGEWTVATKGFGISDEPHSLGQSHEVTPESVGVKGDARMIKISEVASSEELQFNFFVLHSFDLRPMLF